MEKLRIALVQTTLHWETPSTNREMLEARIAPLKGEADLVVLPEMFTSGFTMNASEVAEPVNGPTLEWLKTCSLKYGFALTGSYVVTENDHYFNRLVWVDPEGQTAHYNKRHLFRLSGEDLTYQAGAAPVIVTWRGWRICPLICYDLRFPVYSRNVENYDLLLYVANWPQARRNHWQKLLPARAIENQCYTAGINRIGQDGNGLEYMGDSCLYDFQGEALTGCGSEDNIAVYSMDLHALHTFRTRLPFLEDADSFTIHL
jgi:predicted amidohydrolase